MNSASAMHSSVSPPIGVSHSLMDKFFVLADERSPRYSSLWTYHLNRIRIICNPQNAQNLFGVPDEFCANMLRYPFMPEGIIKHKVAAAVAENERQNMGSSSG
ncbi:uncharacterized protein LAJ45_03805 [Morchella importuna]|uniref:uncharacterized protein n=1 Tax=Morchella importuna TaxID=1174673 RepID=UPI001E8E1D6F|nr:uncharacterized protein LAJ45_03805 [Morchella importuna]KAH8151814.1 hypothetical protein LAJ45_03805 [Morchella importuna]